MLRLRRCLPGLLAACTFLPVAWSQDLPVIRPGSTKASTLEAPAATGDRVKEAPAEADETWQVILIGDERAGYVRTRTQSLPAEGTQPERFRTDMETKMTIKRFGQSLAINLELLTVENLDGGLLSYEFEMGTSPQSTTRSVGTVSGKNLNVKTTIAGTTVEKTTAWDDSVKSPAYQDRLLRKEGLKPGETKSFRMFVPELNTTTDITIAADDYRDVKLPNGKTQKLLKAKVTQAILPTAPITAYFDEKGVGVLAESEMLGMKMRYYEVSKAEALQEISGAELDLAVNTLIPTSPLEKPHATKRVVYRIHVPGEDAKSLFVDGGTQQVKVIDRETIEITVTSKPIPRTGGKTKAEDEFTRPTQLLQSNDAKIGEHLRKAVSPDRNEGESAVALEKYVHEKLDKKNFSTAFASAAEVAETLEGDCSEHAVLLAALLRARGIPSRVAVGIVYVPGQAKMGGHMWTEAKFADDWVPLDATLGRGGIGGGHLKVADSSLSDDAPLPVLAFAPLLSLGAKTKIEVIESSYE